MTTQEAVHQIFERNENAYFQVRLIGAPLASEEVYVNVAKEEPMTVVGRVLKKSSEQDWAELKFDGHVSCYCPADKLDELRVIKEQMFDDFARWGCD